MVHIVACVITRAVALDISHVIAACALTSMITLCMTLHTRKSCTVNNYTAPIAAYLLNRMRSLYMAHI